MVLPGDYMVERVIWSDFWGQLGVELISDLLSWGECIFFKVFFVRCGHDSDLCLTILAVIDDWCGCF